MNYGFLRHKHGHKHSIQYITRIAAIATLISAVLAPTPASAFVGALALTASPRLLAQMDTTLNGLSLTPELSENLSTEGSSIQAMSSNASPLTEEAVWEKKPIKKIAAQPALERVYPKLDAPVVMEGEASYYSRAGCLGCDPMVIMANGQPLDDGALTMAIGADKKHLVGYKAKVTSLATGKSVTVKITDTGGFYQAKYGHRVADLTIATKEAIGIRGGVGQVRVEVF